MQVRDTLSENKPLIRYQSLWLGTGWTLKMNEKLAFNVAVFRDVTWKGENLSQTSPWQFRCSFPIGKQDVQTATKNGISQVQQGVENKLKPISIEGNFSVSFGKDASLDFSPVIGWKISPHWTVGGGLSYQYQKLSSTQSSATQYGARNFVRYTAKKQLPYLQGETQWLNSPSKEINAAGKYERTWNAHVLTGIGYNFPILDKTSLNMSLLYDFTWHKQSPSLYKSPSPWVVRVGLGF
jgi:hypothetical protein